jgi:hypothetical protein
VGGALEYIENILYFRIFYIWLIFADIVIFSTYCEL